MKDLDQLVREAVALRENVSVQFDQVYNQNGDTSRLQRIFNKATARLFRRWSHVFLTKVH